MLTARKVDWQTNEVYHSDARNIQVSQSLFQRMLKTGVVGPARQERMPCTVNLSGLYRVARSCSHLGSCPCAGRGSLNGHLMEDALNLLRARGDAPWRIW